ncbi:hypothetical protein [Aurantimonas coralicida]|uniref:hypothetical protein n=2 Tax=Aurantimonas coralicida TaxID=182270 RepID=UPI00041BEF36|nr:hypothetical protein [Aurantimonas coralicida]
MSDSKMNAPHWQNVISVGNLISVAAMLFAVGGSYATITVGISNLEEKRAAREEKVDQRFDRIERQTADLPQIAYRMTNAESQIQAFNDRLDASFRTISERLDRLAEASAAGTAALSSQIGALDTKVAVITQRIEQVTPGQRTFLDRSQYASGFARQSSQP